jgi:transcriptional regulator with XRE-family HTH domain
MDFKKENLGKRHKKWRKKYLNLNQEQLESKINKTQSSISNYDNGRQIPPYSVLKIYMENGLNLNWLFAGEGSVIREDELSKTRKTTGKTLSKLLEQFEKDSPLEKFFFQINRLSKLNDKLSELPLNQNDIERGKKIINKKILDLIENQK